MAGQYEKAISIHEAIASIDSNDFLLPAIQRRFVWSSLQICVLFDSIMQGYPINSFMFWEVKDKDIKNNYKFYQFLKNYCKRFNEENELQPTTASFKEPMGFKAVIDGQQRLTSLYVGLCGTYAYKNPRVHWPSSQDDNKLPPRKLYLDLLSAGDREEDESLMEYRFKFLTDQQYKSSLDAKEKLHHWFCMHEVRKFDDVQNVADVLPSVVMPYLSKHKLSGNEFAEKTLLKVYEVFRRKPIVHYFNETSQKIDHVLDVFIRTNSGGTKLDFSDLLMSIAVANWDGDFRKEVDSLVKEVHQSTEMGFYLGRDWVLKTCLMLTEADVKFKVKNFKAEQVNTVQRQWSEIKDCIRETFKLIRRFGINPESLTSRNAVIPICYYLYNKRSAGEPLYCSINNLGREGEQRESIGRWLYMVLLKGVFGGQADTILTGMRSLLKEHIELAVFPLEEIIDKYKGSNKDLRFDEEYLNSLLNIQYGEGRCRALLRLLFPEMNPTEIFHIDHLHAKSVFDKKSLKTHDFLNQDVKLMAFYADPGHWNSMANLHLLNDSQNLTKKAKPLSKWVGSEGVTVTQQSLLLNDSVSLEFEDFPEFYRQRHAALKARLKSRVFMTEALVDNTDAADDEDEEVVDEEVSS